MREGLGFVLSFTLIGVAVVILTVAISVALFMVMRHRSKAKR